jgi:hypothetical protein
MALILGIGGAIVGVIVSVPIIIAICRSSWDGPLRESLTPLYIALALPCLHACADFCQRRSHRLFNLLGVDLYKLAQPKKMPPLSLRQMRKFLALLFSLGLLLSAAPSANAHAQQNLASAYLYPADVSSFPTISAFLDVFDSNGIFASGLKPEAVSVIEDGQPLPVNALNEIAVPCGLSLPSTRAIIGRVIRPLIFRFQRVSNIGAMGASRPWLPDDYSLVSQAGPVINHASAAGTWWA